MKKVIKFLWHALGVIYAPIYLVFWLLHKVVRFALAICYFGLLDGRKGIDIIKYLFKPYGKV